MELRRVHDARRACSTPLAYFKAGVSVAPVSDWRLYDTIYTERYMGRPQDNPEAYKDSSPVQSCRRFYR